jgi:hypothetical protein
MSEKKRMKDLWMVENASGASKSYWTKIGVAFENRDGSWSLELSALPVSGKIQMRDPVKTDPVKTFGCLKCGADADDGGGCLKHGR